MNAQVEDPETIICHQCGMETPFDESLGAEIGDDGKWQDVCRECYDEIVEACQICGRDDVMPSNVSEFIVVKTELADTASRLPGIYKIKHRPFLSIPMIGSGSLHASDVVFVDRLPRRDSKFEISGHTCNECAKPYASKFEAVYGKVRPARNFRRDPMEERERIHAAATVADNPDMLRDLEIDTADEDLQRWCPLPVFATTYHEQLFLEHKGVRVYWTSRGSANWLTMRPEPSFRNTSYWPPGIVFAPSGLKTWEDIQLDPDRRKDQWGAYYDTGYRYGHEHDYLNAARAACIRAIDQGLITTRHAPEDAR